LAAATIWRVIGLGGDYLRVTWATDMKAYALLAGCALAVAYSEGRLPKPGRWVAPVSVAGVAGLSAVWAIRNGTAGFTYFDFAVVGLSAAAIWGGTQPVRLLEGSVLRWFGKVSYGLYLWNNVIFNRPEWYQLPFGRELAFAVMLLIVWLSWRAVEAPMLRLKTRSTTTPGRLRLPADSRIRQEPARHSR
jgi:peptidoglycan/LPS O-acetylase OafA/YrhL